MTEDTGKTARFFVYDGQLFVRAVNKDGIAMWFDLHKGLTPQSKANELEAAFKERQK